MRISMVIAYDGTLFNGWQYQTNKRTVQETIEQALEKLLKTKIHITASGRTDSGVHAVGQVCHFDIADDCPIPPEKYAECLNIILPEDVKILSSKQESNEFDCNRQAKKKTYCYSIYLSTKTNPIKERFCVKYSFLPDMILMRQAAKMLEGEHDFKAFCASGSSVKTTVRTIYSITIEEGESYGSKDIKIFVCGNGFLYNMVRSIAGELLDIACGRRTLADLKLALETGDRKKIGRTMPAKGLMLMNVVYDI